MSMIDALKKKPNALVRVGCSLKHVVYDDRIRQYIKRNLAEKIVDHLLNKKLIVFDETKDGNETTIDAFFYVVDTKKLK